jgi:hypothetical protein
MPCAKAALGSNGHSNLAYESPKYSTSGLGNVTVFLPREPPKYVQFCRGMDGVIRLES